MPQKKVTLMRHGAYDYRDMGLSEAGKEQVDNVAAQLAENGLIPDAIVHSPVKRAVQTALRAQAVFNKVAGVEIPLIEKANLADHARSSVSDLQTLDEGLQSILVVSHMPNVETLSGMFGSSVCPDTAQAVVFNAEVDSWKNLGRAGRAQTFRPR